MGEVSSSTLNMLLQILLTLTVVELSLCQQDYYRDSADRNQQQHYNYNPAAQQSQQQKLLDRAYETNFNLQRDPYYQEPYEEQADFPAQPFQYEYGGADSYGRHFAKTESKDAEGVVKGEYRVELPDGRVQIVSYRADPELGYQADVRYEGEAKPYNPEEEELEYQRRKQYVPQHKPYKR